ncbi:hypothetical protein SDC9_167902 [bioreactor metagenome]|uniref:Uncharacterized protein n=1 Tax=bioreactor metagenome TaxID=1076179 RepID=A0A645G9D8_9ZZZZ
MHMAHGSTQHARGIEHAAHIPDGQHLVRGRVVQLKALQQLAYRLGDGQIACRLQHHEALARLLIQHDLAEGADLVESGIGAGVGQKHQAGVELEGDAVCHG